MSDILAIDVGTTALKLAVFTAELEKRCEASQRYEVNLYDQGKADIDPQKWWSALCHCCSEIAEHLAGVRVISLSVTTPGLAPMASDGRALGPAILFFDGRSHEEAKRARELVGEDRFLEDGCNLPVSGGSSLSSMLWIREHQPEVWEATSKFGHCNTYMVKRLSGEWAIDPSTTSITGLYNTARHDLTWNSHVLEACRLPESKLPPLMHSHSRAGRIRTEVARELGLPEECDVLCGGNDAVLAALSAGATTPGDITYIAGTCEITYVCVDRPVRSTNFNVRCHAVPDRWLTFFVLNTGGRALEWFHSVFCQDMSRHTFFEEYVPSVLTRFLEGGDADDVDVQLPEYIPFLQGSRYSVERLRAAFSGLTLETTRDGLLLALLKGNALYQATHLREVADLVKLNTTIRTTGGAASIRGFLAARKRWTGDFEYCFQDQSSLLGAAMLGQFFQTQRYG
jgi:xylulokinase